MRLMIDWPVIIQCSCDTNLCHFSLSSRYPAKVNLHSPNLPTKYPDKERQAYSATRDDDPVNLTTLKPVI